MNDRILVRVQEAADLLSLPRSTAYTLIARGQLPSVRLGNIIRVPLQALLDLIDHTRPYGSGGVRPGGEEAE